MLSIRQYIHVYVHFNITVSYKLSPMTGDCKDIYVVTFTKVKNMHAECMVSNDRTADTEINM